MSDRARGLLHGQLLTGLEAARAALDLAKRGESLLEDGDRAQLRYLAGYLAGIEQRAWERHRQEDRPRKRAAGARHR